MSIRAFILLAFLQFAIDRTSHTLLFPLPDQLQSPAISGMMAHTIFRYDNSKRVTYITSYIFTFLEIPKQYRGDGVPDYFGNQGVLLGCVLL
jgi:hypothetical protein